MRKAVLLFTSLVSVLLLASGGALAADLDRKEAENAGGLAAIDGQRFYDADATGQTGTTANALRYETNGGPDSYTLTVGPRDRASAVVVRSRAGSNNDSFTSINVVVGGKPQTAKTIGYGSAAKSYVDRSWVLANPLEPGQHTLKVNGAGLTATADDLVTDYVRLEGTGVSDSDGDDVPDSIDNCKATPNPEQLDFDGDGAGDACDADPRPGCTDVITSSTDLDAAIPATDNGARNAYCFYPGTYEVNRTVENHGDVFRGYKGTEVAVGPAFDPALEVVIKPDPLNNEVQDEATKSVVRMVGAARMERIEVRDAKGLYVPNYRKGEPCDNPSDDLLRCPRAGTGVNISMGEANGDARLTHVRSTRAEAVGVANAHGVISRSEFDLNGFNDDFRGYTAAGVKGVTEYEAANNYVHDNYANGLWCDHGCENDPQRANGAWFHDNLVVGNDTWGIRYEYSPRDANVAVEPAFLAERNRVHGNTVGGASMKDVQNGTLRGNTFGVGFGYGHNDPPAPGSNQGSAAVFIDDSTRAPRNDNLRVDDNDMGGEKINSCSASGVVSCARNTNVGQ